MEFPLSDVVAVCGFCVLLWAWAPALRVLPLLAAIAFPLYPQDAAFVAYIVVLFFGTPIELISAVIDRRS